MGLEYSYHSVIVWILCNHCLESITLVGVVPLTSEWLTPTNTCYSISQLSLTVSAHVEKPQPIIDSESGSTLEECELILDTFSWIVMFITMQVVGLLSSPLAGWLCDRHGPTRIQTSGALIMVITNCVYAFSTEIECVIFARAINGVGTAFILCSECAFILSQSPSEEIKNKTVFFLYCASGVEYIGVTFVGVLFDAIGQAIPFLFLAVCFSISSIMLAYFGSDRHQKHKNKVNNYADETTNVTQQHPSDDFKVLFHDKKLQITAFATFASTIPRASLLSVYGIWTSEEFGSTVTEYSLAWLPAGCCYIAIHIPAIYIILKYFKYSWLCAMISLFIGASMTLVVPWTSSLPASMIPLALSVSFGGLCRTVLVALITSYCKSKFPHFGSYVSCSLVFSGFFIPYIIGPVIAILLINSYGLLSATILSSFISFVALPLIPRLRNRDIKPEETPLLTNY